MSQEKYDIFISYSRKDTAIADQICAALDSVGITYFIDRQGIGGGFEFPTVLAENIVNSKLFLLLASKNSYESKFTMSEIVFAFNKKPKNTILPYIIDNSTLPISLEFVFAGINWRNVSDHPIETTLVDDLLKLLGRERILSTKTASALTEREKYLLSLPDDELESFRENRRCGFKLKNTGEVVIPAKYTKSNFWFSEGLVGVKSRGLWGYIDKTGKEIIPLKYDNAGDFSEGLACVQIDYRYGFIDKEGNEVISLMYDEAYSFSEGLACVKLNGKWGCIDKTGKEVVPLKYDEIEYFAEDLAKVKLNGKCGYVDKTYKEVLSLMDDDADSFSEGLASVKLNGKWGYVDKTGKVVISLKYDVAWSFREGLAMVNMGQKRTHICGGKYGFIDKTGKEIIPLKYDCARPFSEGLANVGLNGKFGFIDKEGNEVIPLRFGIVTIPDFRNGKGRVELNGEEFYIDKNGNRVD